MANEELGLDTSSINPVFTRSGHNTRFDSVAEPSVESKSPFRRTKIVATLGPASTSFDIISQLVRAGVDVFRLNFSHGSIDDHRIRAQHVRHAAAEQGVEVALLGDLQGPKIRIRGFKSGSITISRGDHIALDTSLGPAQGDAVQVGVDYHHLPESVEHGDTLLLDDGRIRLRVLDITGTRVACEVLLGGTLSGSKGLNRLGGGLSAPTFTPKDKNDISHATELGLDYVAVSFPSSAADISIARTLLDKAGSKAGVIAKIERAEAVASDQVMDELILAADGVMVARGDLGVEIGDAQLIGIQKKLITRARQLNRVVITATQMMETMISNPFPTRAEVFDVANAVLDGTDAVMLSGETASGKYPVQTVSAMAETCVGAEQQPSTQKSGHRMERVFERVDEAIAMSAVYAANHLDNVRGVICLTETGATPLWMSRLRSGIPFYALSRNPSTLRRVKLYRGVMPVMFDALDSEPEGVAEEALAVLKRQALATGGDRFILTHGERQGQNAGTNTLSIITV